MFGRKTKNLKIDIRLFNKIRDLVNNIDFHKNGSVTLYGVYSDWAIVSPVPDDIATEFVEYEGEKIGLLSRSVLRAVFFTKHGAEKYIASQVKFLGNPKINPLSVSVGESQPELNFIASALAFIFGNKNEK